MKTYINKFQKEALEKIAGISNHFNEPTITLLKVSQIATQALSNYKERGKEPSERMYSEEEVSNVSILKWLQKQKFQTEYGATGEYKMYFSVDMPKIIRAFIQSLSQEDKPTEEVNSCSNCKHFYSASPCADQPYPEFACSKGHWDGIASNDELDALYNKIECIDHSVISKIEHTQISVEEKAEKEAADGTDYWEGYEKGHQSGREEAIQEMIDWVKGRADYTSVSPLALMKKLLELKTQPNE